MRFVNLDRSKGPSLSILKQVRVSCLCTKPLQMPLSGNLSRDRSKFCDPLVTDYIVSWDELVTIDETRCIQPFYPAPCDQHPECQYIATGQRPKAIKNIHTYKGTKNIRIYNATPSPQHTNSRDKHTRTIAPSHNSKCATTPSTLPHLRPRHLRHLTPHQRPTLPSRNPRALPPPLPRQPHLPHRAPNPLVHQTRPQPQPQLLARRTGPMPREARPPLTHLPHRQPVRLVCRAAGTTTRKV